MARSEARIAVSIWSDDDFTALTPLAQRMFMFLLSQPDLAHDGVLALRERRWSKTAAGLTPAQVSEHLAELVAARFIVIDEDTEELLIRSFIRRDKVYRQPNVLRAAADHLETVTSPIIRAAVAEELRRVAAADDIGAGSASVVAEMLSTLGTPSGNPSPNPSGDPSGEGFGDAGEPFSKASRESSGHIDDSSEIVPQCGTEAEIDKTATDSSAPYVSAARKGSGNPSGNPSPNPSAGTPGDRGIVTAVSSDSPIPYPLTPNPDPRPLAKRADRARAKRATTDDPLFDEFWAAYPRREAKGAARKAWDKAIKRADPAEIIAGARLYRDRPDRDPRYTAHAATWLNADRWTDEPPPVAAHTHRHRPYHNPTDMTAYAEGL